MTTQDSLTWEKTKNIIVMGVGALLIWLLGILLSGQNQINVTLMEVKKDIAVFSAESKRQKDDIEDLQNQLAMMGMDTSSVKARIGVLERRGK